MKYTFEDWLRSNFYNEKNYSDEYVCNDSEQYLHLVEMDKMTYEVLNKIQDEQSKAYEYMIESSLKTNENYFKRQTAKSLDLQKVIEIKIKKIEKYIEENEDLYYDVILPRMHRGMKLGAKYIIPQQYLKYKKNELLDAFIVIHAPYQININGNLVAFPTDEQMKYAQMEVQILWLKKLQQYSEVEMCKVSFERMQQNTGKGYFEALQRSFYKTYPQPNLKILESELSPLRDFVDNTLNNCSVKDAFEKRNGWIVKQDEQHEYLRMENGFYHNNLCKDNLNGLASNVYGKYVLYKKWLEDQLAPDQQTGNIVDSPTIIEQKSFDCTLTDERFDKIYDLVKDIKLFKEPFEVSDLKNIFNSSTTKNYHITNNQNLACLFNYLQPGFITVKWQSVIENNKCLIGSKGKHITAKNLSATLANVKFNTNVSKKIKTTISNL